jgi:hypothetical protein
MLGGEPGALAFGFGTRHDARVSAHSPIESVNESAESRHRYFSTSGAAASETVMWIAAGS